MESEQNVGISNSEERTICCYLLEGSVRNMFLFIRVQSKQYVDIYKSAEREICFSS